MRKNSQRTNRTRSKPWSKRPVNLGVVDDWEEEPVSPWQYDYDGYEDKSVSFVLWSNHVFGGAPPFIQEDFHKKARKLAMKIGKWIDEKKPDTYEYDGYYVEC